MKSSLKRSRHFLRKSRLQCVRRLWRNFRAPPPGRPKSATKWAIERIKVCSEPIRGAPVIDNGGQTHEDRRHRRNRPDRLEDRRHSASARPRRRRRLAPKRRQHPHRRGAQRGLGRRAGGDRPRQFALIRRQGGARILRDFRAPPSPGGGLSGRPASRRAIHRRNRPDRQWLFPRQGRPGETD